MLNPPLSYSIPGGKRLSGSLRCKDLTRSGGIAVPRAPGTRESAQ